MIGRLVATSALALGASALIIPPGISSENNVAPSLSVSVVDPKQRAITIPCSECAFSIPPSTTEEATEDGEDFVWIQGGANSLVLNFTVSEDGGKLQLNGGDIYPPHFLQSGGFGGESIYVKQVPSQAGLVDIKNGEVRSTDLEVTAYGLREMDEEPLSPNGDLLVPIRLQILGLENEFMGLDEVEIRMLKTGDGELLIMDITTIAMAEVEAVPFPPPSHHHDMDDEEEFGPPFSHHGPGDRPQGPPHDLDDDEEIFPPHDMDDDEGVFPPSAHHGHSGRPHGPPHDMDDDKEAGNSPPPFFHHGHSGKPHGPHHGIHETECNMLPAPLCRFKSMIESKIDAAMGPPRGFRHGRPGCQKGQGKHLPGHIRPHFDKSGEENKSNHHHGRPHHMRPHGGPGRHNHGNHGHMFRHHFLHAFAKGMVAVLIPVMAGITVGMTVSLLGLVVGRLIGFLWIKLVRGGKRGSASIALTEDVVEEGEGKAMLAQMEGEEKLPVYEDAPAYVEVVEEKK